MKKEITEKIALQKITKVCATKEYCIAEVKDKLGNWGLTNEETERILEFLLKEKFVDESRYCDAFIHDKLHYNKWGRLKISHFLFQKRIPSNMIDSHLNKINLDTYKSILISLLRSKKKNIKASDDFELKNKLFRFGLSRGFESELIQECLTHLNKND